MKIHPAKTYHLKKSQTILEIVLSIGLAVMVLSALLVLGAASSKTVASSLKRSQATKLAVNGMEAMRYKRDTEGFTTLISTCYTINSGLGSAVTQDTTCNFNNVDVDSIKFRRKIQVVDVAGSSYSKQVNVTVQWDEGNGVKDVQISTILSKW